MNIQEKRLKELESHLKSTNTSVILDAILSLRNVEPCSGAIRLLTELFNSSSNSSVKSHVTEFLNDMKEKSFTGEVIAEIKKNYKQETIKMLVSSCWQSGLDYSQYATDFALIFGTGNYETAIECFSVIESNLPSIPRKTRDHIIILLRENEDIRNSSKAALMNELVSLLK